MLLRLTLPGINDELSSNLVTAIHASEGSLVPVGGKLMDLTLTLGETQSQDCPPASHFRLSARDRVWVRKWFVAAGNTPAIGTDLGLFSTEPDEAIDAMPQRQLRLTIAGIVPDFDFGA